MTNIRQALRSIGWTMAAACLAATPAAAQPVVRGITNAANGDITQVARGSFVSIFGQNLGTTAGPPSALPLPTNMGGATVNIKPNSGTKTYQAYLHFVSTGQINAIIPSAVPAGPASLTVTVNSATSPPVPVQIAENSFGIFTINSQPAGMAIAQNYESPTSLPLNLYTNAARPGQTIILWGTGLGAYTGGSDGDAPQAGNIVNNAQVLIDGYAITPFYAGRAPGIPGVDQINFTLPDSAPIPDGCSLEVQVQVGSFTQPSGATIAKSSNGPVCEHPYGLSQDQLVALQSGSTLKAMMVQLYHSVGVQGIVNGSVLGSIQDEVEVGLRKFAANGSPLTDQGYPYALQQAAGSCNVIKAGGSDFEFVDHTDFINLLNFPLDSGSNSVLSGPGGTMTLAPFGGLTTLFQGVAIPGSPVGSAFLQNGNYTLAIPGGKDVAAVQAQFVLQNQFSANFPSSISKGKPLTLTWTGGNDGDLVRIFVTGITFSGASPLITCTANATDHTFTIPGDLTGQLTSDQPVGVLGFYSIGAPASLSVPLTGGGSLDSAKVQLNVLEAFTAVPLQ
ncbi:MAG: hypothetical protein LAP38_06790 [Acidobacteriia bacterium]|nr:hypothetical protein [Terriglobia bacterium]